LSHCTVEGCECTLANLAKPVALVVSLWKPFIGHLFATLRYSVDSWPPKYCCS